MTPEDTLSAFFAHAAPPARDLAFEATVAERIARRRAWLSVLALAPWTIAAVVLCWAFGPLLTPVLAGAGRDLAPAIAILTLTALGVATLIGASRRLQRFQAS